MNRPCRLRMSLVVRSVLLVALLSGAPIAGQTEPAITDTDALSSPQRLHEIKQDCWARSLALRESPASPDMSEGHRVTFDCLLEAASLEFDENIASPSFQTAEFVQRLRRLSEQQGEFTVALFTSRCAPCGTMWGPVEASLETAALESYLNEIWRYYARNSPQ